MNLLEFLTSTAPTPATRALSLVHCTTVGAGLRVLESGKLNPTRCKVYKDDLLYLFYGRPAYKPSQGGGPSAIVEQAPVCFIFDPGILRDAKRMLPFYSGGFARYKAHVGTNLKRGDFELSGDELIPRRLVDAFFETNRNYYYQQSTLREGSLPLSRQSARALARLIADPNIRADDDRCGTIEVQFALGIDLAAALQAIIAPSQFFDDPVFKTAQAASPSMAPITYPIYGRMDPIGFANTIYERVEAFLIDEKVFA